MIRFATPAAFRRMTLVWAPCFLLVMVSMSAFAQVPPAQWKQFNEELESRRGLPKAGVTWGTAQELPAWLTAQTEFEEQVDNQRLAMRQALREELDANFDHTPLREVLDFYAEALSTTFYLNQTELDLLGVDAETPVTLQAPKIAARQALALILAPLELTHCVRENVIEITSKDALNSDPEIRFYDMAWILEKSDDAKPLINAIELTLHPDSWTSAGGTSSIQAVGSILVIAAPEPTQRDIESLFGNLLRLRKSRASKKPPVQILNTPKHL